MKIISYIHNRLVQESFTEKNLLLLQIINQIFIQAKIIMIKMIILAHPIMIKLCLLTK